MTSSCKWPIVSYSLNNVIWTRFDHEHNKKNFTNNQDFHNCTLVLIFFSEWKNLVLRTHSLSPQMPVTTHEEPGTTSHIIKFKSHTKITAHGKKTTANTCQRKMQKNVTLTRKIQWNSVSVSMYISLKTITWGALQPLFPVKWSLVITPFPPPPPPKKQQWQQQQSGKESEKSRDDRKSEK